MFRLSMNTTGIDRLLALERMLRIADRAARVSRLLPTGILRSTMTSGWNFRTSFSTRVAWNPL
jgi:hypothetical protein